MSNRVEVFVQHLFLCCQFKAGLCQPVTTALWQILSELCVYVASRQQNINNFGTINIVNDISTQIRVQTPRYLWAGENEFRNSEGVRGFSLFKISRLARRPNQFSFILYWETLKMWVNRPARKADQSHQCSIDVRNEWLYKSVCWAWTGLIWLGIGPVFRLKICTAHPIFFG